MKFVCIDSSGFNDLIKGKIYIGKYTDYGSEKRIIVDNDNGHVYFSWRFKSLININQNIKIL